MNGAAKFRLHWHPPTARIPQWQPSDSLTCRAVNAVVVCFLFFFGSVWSVFDTARLPCQRARLFALTRQIMRVTKTGPGLDEGRRNSPACTQALPAGVCGASQGLSGWVSPSSAGDRDLRVLENHFTRRCRGGASPRPSDAPHIADFSGRFPFFC
jgi:hypothetical protein